MSDKFDKYASGLDSPANESTLLVANNGAPIPSIPRCLYVSTDGVLVFTDRLGTVTTINVFAGSILPIRPIYCNVGTTSTVYGWV